MMIIKKICLILSCICCTQWMQGRILQVCPDCSLSSVATGVEMADAGDTVLVKKAIYRENQIEIHQAITLLGEGKPVIDGMGENEIIVVFADGVTIQGLELRNVGISFLKDRAAIRLVQCKGVLVEDNILRNTFFGIYLQKSDSCIIRGNQIIGEAQDEASAGNAIHIWKASHVQVENNYAAFHRDGMYFEFVDNSLIAGNTCEQNLRYGLHFMFSNRDVYRENTFRANGVGVAVMFSKEIEMLKNTFSDNWGGASYGILLKEISDGRMKGNEFLRNTKGIYAEGTNRLQLHNNQFIENGWALDIKGNCLDNRIEHNNFIGNSFEVITNSKRNLNYFNENYWSQYRGYDLDKDGRGDIAHQPVRLFSLLTEEVPAAIVMMHSMVSQLLDYSERMFPDLVPIALQDEQPLMNPIPYDSDSSTQ